MCRSFATRPIPTELIERLLYAANRAPTAGNVRTSEIVLIKNQHTIKEIRKISPGFGGTCPILLAICTNKRSTQEDDVASFDAGTVAENIALAAIDLGLGVCFLKSFPDTIVEKILKLPTQKAKIEMLVCVGYPAEDYTKFRIRSTPIRLFEETYGNNPEPNKGSPQAPSDLDEEAHSLNNPEAHEMPREERNDSHSPLFDLALFILTSARTTIDESPRYGPKRLVDTLIRLLDMPKGSLRQSSDERDGDFLNSIRAELATRTDLRSSSMVYSNEFKEFLDHLIERFVTEMEKQREA